MLNYSVEIWGNYNMVQKKLYSNIETLNELITLFINKYDIMQNYNMNLSKLSNNKINVKNLDSLSEGISFLKGDIINQYNYINEYLNCIKDEIINPLKSDYQILIKKINNNSTEMISIYKTYKASLAQLELSKNRFHASLKEAEQIKVKIEYYKIKLNIIQSNKNLNLNDDINNINDFIEKIQEEELKLDNIFKIAKEKERVYINLINYTNRLQEDYIEIKNKNLNQIQDLEEQLGNIIKDALRKFALFQLAYLRNTQYDMDKNIKILESINIKNDINNFILTNKTDDIPPSKIIYEPYISYLNDENRNDNIIKLGSLTKEKINEIQKFIKNIFPLEKTTEIKMKTKIEADLELLTLKIFSNNSSEPEENIDINKIISNKKLRRILLNKINNYLIKDKEKNSLSDKTYNIIYEILKQSLNKLQSDNDFESAKIILNLSNILYKNNETKNFYNNLKNENLITNFEFWKEMIKYNITNERRQNKAKEMEIKNKSINENEIKDIVKNNLNIFIKYMIEFECRSIYLTRIIQEFGDYYQLEKSFINDYIVKIKDYENIQNKKNENINNIDTNIGTNIGTNNNSDSDDEEDNIINEEDLVIDKIE